MKKVLHVTAHLGGGVGSVLSAVAIQAKKARSPFMHQILQLEPTENPHFPNICAANGIPLYLAGKDDTIQKLSEADLVQIEWWHHPLTMRFMHELLGRISCRLLVWSHISGCTYPRLPAAFATIPDTFLFSTPFSLNNPSWTDTQRKTIRENSSVVASSAGSFGATLKKIPHDGFHIGYVGFLGYSKTHPEYVRFCQAVDLPDVHFTVVGDTSFGAAMINDVTHAGLRSRFTFTGYSTHVQQELAKFDVFGYPLNPNHTGTSENALLEAMAAGIVPVVLNQCAEKYLVQDGVNGITVNNPKEYGDAMRYLYTHPQKREQMGENARRTVRSRYTIENTVQSLDAAYSCIAVRPKRTHPVESAFGRAAHEWFLSCCGDFADSYRLWLHPETQRDPAALSRAEQAIELSASVVGGQSKASLRQYARYFPQDRVLSAWRGILDRA